MLSLLSGRRGQIESIHTRKTKKTKDKEMQYERTGQIQQREISGYDLLSRFEEYRKKRKKGTEIPHEGKLDLPQGRRVFGQPRPLHRLRAGRHPPCGRPAKQHRQLYCPTLIVAPITSKAGKKPSQPTHYYAERIHGLELPGMVLLEQIKTIDKRRVKKYLGRMTRQQMDEIGEAIEEALGLYVPEEMEAP
jgi:mRNA-degrading endonuclease toxin of MazEF toxin-antitoxin module